MENFNKVIEQLKECTFRAESYIFYIQPNIQYCNTDIKLNINIPINVFENYPYNPFQYPYWIGNMYIIQTPAWNYIYYYLKKYKYSYRDEYPNHVIYDYLKSYQFVIDMIKDRYDYIELYYGHILLYKSYKKWLFNHYLNEIDIYNDIVYYNFTLESKFKQQMLKEIMDEENCKHYQSYHIIQHLFRLEINSQYILQFLLI